MFRSFRRSLAMALVLSLVAGLTLTTGLAGPASAAATPVAWDMVGSTSQNLISFTNNAPAFSSPADGFAKFQRGVSPTIPFDVLDDSNGTFPADSQGIVDATNTAEFFAATDTENDDTAGAPVSAVWVFDISGAGDLGLSIDMGAMGDFEAADDVTWAYQVDAGPVQTAFELVADESASRAYTLADGDVVVLNDPFDVGTVALDNVLRAVTTPITGSGATLTLTLTIDMNGGGEAVAFQDIVILEDFSSEGTGPVPGDLVITEIMQNPAALADSAGEWFELTNVSGADIDIDGWEIRDDGSDSHIISGSLVVPAGGSVVLANTAAATTEVDYVYGTSWFLSNSADEVILEDPSGTVFDGVSYDGGPTFPDPTGAAMNLDVDSTDTTSNDSGGNWCEATAAYDTGDLGTPGAPNRDCSLVEAFVHDIQGGGSAVTGSGPWSIEAVVVGDFQADDQLRGFFVQEEDSDIDPDTSTSEGIFVFCGACPVDVAVGDLVTVVGSASEFFDMSQISATGTSDVTVVSSGNPLPTPASVDLPVVAPDLDAFYEQFEGMLVNFTDELTVSEYFQLARYGQVVLYEGGRPLQYTQANTPDASGYADYQDGLARRRVILDDDDNVQNSPLPDGVVYHPLPGGLSIGTQGIDYFRGGDTIASLTGVLHWSWAGSGGTDAWRIRPVDTDSYRPTFDVENPRSAVPVVAGDLHVASFNVLNYFTTIDSRGADSQAELDRQRAKIAAAIVEIDADVVGLIEIENNGPTAIADLLTALPDYDYIDTGVIGTDEIAVAFIYKPATVAPVGNFAILDSTVDPRFDDTRNRPALLQTFEQKATGERVNVVVNHLKSKGSSCGAGDDDPTGGAGNCDLTRYRAAVALVDWLATDPTGVGDPDHLIIGDLNSYAAEDPILAILAGAASGSGGSYTNLVAGSYSYLFDGQVGTLDYALSNAALTPQVTGTAVWHINADEVPLFDYNDDVLDPGAEASFEEEPDGNPLYEPNPFRASDHDPVIVGLDLDSVPDVPTCRGLEATIVGTNGDDVIVGTSGADVIVGLGGDDVIRGGNGDDVICGGDGDDDLDGQNGDDVVSGDYGRDTVAGGNGKDTVDGGDLADRVVGGNGKDALSGGLGDDHLDGGNGNDTVDGGAGTDTCVAGESVTNCEL